MNPSVSFKESPDRRNVSKPLWGTLEYGVESRRR